MIRAGQYVQLRVTPAVVTICALPSDGGQLLAAHPRATRRGCWVTDPAHWDGLPDGHTRAVTLDLPPAPAAAGQPAAPGLLTAYSPGHAAAATPVARRPLSDYDTAAGSAPGASDEEQR